MRRFSVVIADFRNMLKVWGCRLGDTWKRFNIANYAKRIWLQTLYQMHLEMQHLHFQERFEKPLGFVRCPLNRLKIFKLLCKKDNVAHLKFMVCDRSVKCVRINLKTYGANINFEIPVNWFEDVPQLNWCSEYTSSCFCWSMYPLSDLKLLPQCKYQSVGWCACIVWGDVIRKTRRMRVVWNFSQH